MKPVVVLCGTFPGLAEERLAEETELRRVNIDKRELSEAISDANGLILRNMPYIDDELLSRAPKLKVIGRFGVGVDNVDLEAAKRRGVRVVYTPGVNADAVAEHTFALLLALAKRLRFWHDALLGGEYRLRWTEQSFEVQGKVLGIIGFGYVGRAVAQRAKAFKMHLLVYDPFVPPETITSFEAESVPLDELLRRSDFVTLHVPLTEQTRGLINRERLALVKRGSFLVNTSRGEVCDLDALYEALQSGQLAGVALDVFPNEPPDISHPIFSHPNFVGTPHVASHTPETLKRMALVVVEQVLKVLRGEEPDFAVV
ncbi:MAG: hydroxyacid dehydrogenase [Armatimonadetes bacterium]|nr:hydroxyacid dehydrogenase [Armatimonadota bacterium]